MYDVHSPCTYKMKKSWKVQKKSKKAKEFMCVSFELSAWRRRRRGPSMVTLYLESQVSYERKL